MNDQLGGQIDLRQLFDTCSSLESINASSFHGAATARDTHVLCVLIGSPSFSDDEAESAAREAGLAAGFLSTWRKHGTAAPSRVRGA